MTLTPRESKFQNINKYNANDVLFTDEFNSNTEINFLIKKTIKNINNKIIDISQKDFIDGPFVIKNPGYYKLSENIIFHPNKNNNGKPTQKQLETLPKAFNLGFFAAIIIDSDNVILDLNNKFVKQSLLFSVQQTFYANIQIGGSPFIKKQGPGDFPNLVNAPSNVVIKDGFLELSSHHGIHCATGVNKCIINNLKITEFGVAGIAINGGNSLYLSDIIVDNNKTNILFNSQLSFAIFMIPHFEKLLEENKNLAVTILKKQVRVETLYLSLKNEIELAFQSIDNNIPYNGIFKNKDHPLYDGNIYGIVLNSKGVLVNDFKPLNLENKNNNFDIVLDNIKILNCVSSSKEIIVMTTNEILKEKIAYGSGIVKGVHGDVLDVEKCTDNFGNYTSHLITNCQICLAKFKHLLNHNTANIPDIIIKWSENSKLSLYDYIKHKQVYIIRGRDSMAHIMKGNIGLFISQGDNVIANDITINNIDNKATVSEKFQSAPEFDKLATTYGALITGSKDICFKNIDIKAINSKEGQTETIAFKNDCLNFKIIN